MSKIKSIWSQADKFLTLARKIKLSKLKAVKTSMQVQRSTILLGLLK